MFLILSQVSKMLDVFFAIVLIRIFNWHFDRVLCSPMLKLLSLKVSSYIYK